MLNRFFRWLAPKPKRVEPEITYGHYQRMIAENWRIQRVRVLGLEIARLKRQKKRHSHLQQELDRLNA